MKRYTLLFVFLLTATVAWYGSELRRGWQQIQALNLSVENIDMATINTLKEELQTLPSVYPYTPLKKNAQRAQNMIVKLAEFETRFGTEDLLQAQTIDELFQLNDEALAIVHDTQSLLRLAPITWLNSEQQLIISEKKNQLKTFETVLNHIKNAEYTIDYLVREEASIVILLQNGNEPRSTGGFIGSLLVIDFQADGQIELNFEDIYALDRLIPADQTLAAPDFFHGLDQTISLRDGNFWPDFPTSADYIRRQLIAAGHKEPLIIVGSNLRTAQVILELGGSVTLEQWGLELTAENFDTALQFLVEGKVTGRYAVKEPVELFMQKVFAPEYLAGIAPADILQYDWHSFFAQKNILAYSVEPKLQKIFDSWGISGRVEKHPLAENFLQFDFVSVGANKSEKFMWTKLDHNSLISPDGIVVNTLKIKRTHALRGGEIEDQIGFDTLPINVRNILNEDLKWKLGAGENRTILRVWIPESAELVKTDNPSGEVFLREEIDENIDTGLKNLKYLEVPLFVLPGESVEATITYQTTIKRGSHNWRPYWLQLTGTPGRKQTKIFTSLSLTETGKFSAETFNLGRPVDLVDQDFRAVVEF